ncbi:hypothetical protein ACFY72_35010 [Streptomyces globisporus]|uniref:hypothetical protein n=1 Tax=Streptomyces globisporus TaxID=1908 RepID=UPI0036A7BBDE
MMGADPTAESPGGSPFASRWWQVCGLFLGVLLILGIVTVVVQQPGGDGNETDAAPGASASSSSPGPAPSGSGKGCPDLDASEDLPRTAPDTSWELTRTVALPVSETAGPARVDGDVARCYAQSPTGALIAAAQISARYVVAEDWQSVVKKQTYGAGQQPLLEQRTAYEATAEPVAPVPGELGQVAGYQFVTYTPELAVLQLVNRFGDSGVMQATTITLRWHEGDWQMELPSAAPPQKTVDDLTGYVPWGGV